MAHLLYENIRGEKKLFKAFPPTPGNCRKAKPAVADGWVRESKSSQVCGGFTASHL